MPSYFDLTQGFGNDLKLGAGLELGSLTGRTRIPQRPLSPEEETGLLDAAMGGLQYFGETLGKPGRAVAGSLNYLLGGEAGGGLLNLIPFSDTAGITDPKEWVDMRKVMTTLGAPETKPGIMATLSDPADLALDVAGFAGDVLTDPLTWMLGPMTSFTKTGKAAAEAAKIAKMRHGIQQVDKVLVDTGRVAGAATKGNVQGSTMSAVIQELRNGERAAASMKVPLFSEPFYQTGQRINNKAADWIEAMYFGTWSPIRSFRYLFSKDVGAIFPGASQIAKEKARSKMLNIVGAFKDTLPVVDKRLASLDQLYVGIKETAKESNNILKFNDVDAMARYMTEELGRTGAGYRGAVEMLDGELSNMASPGDIQNMARNLFSITEGMTRMKNMAAKEARKQGINLGWLDDVFAAHFPRRPSDPRHAAAWSKIMKKTLLPGNVSYGARRADILTDLPGGTWTVNRMSMDPLLTATGKANMAKGEFDETIRLALLDIDETMEVAGKSTEELQSLWVWHNHINPELETLIERNAFDPEDVGKVQKWLMEGVKEGEETVGGKLALADEGPQAAKLVEYFRQLPEDVLETGLFDKSFTQDWMDYIENMAVATSNYQSMHGFLRSSAFLAKPGEEVSTGMPLGQAWDQLSEEVLPQAKQPWKTSKRPLLNKQGKGHLIRNTLDELWQRDRELAEKVGLPESHELFNIYESSGKNVYTKAGGWPRGKGLSGVEGKGPMEGIKYEVGQVPPKMTREFETVSEGIGEGILKPMSLNDMDDLIVPDSIQNALINAHKLDPKVAAKHGLPDITDVRVIVTEAADTRDFSKVIALYDQIDDIRSVYPADAVKMGLPASHTMLDTKMMEKAENLVRISEDAPEMMKRYGELVQPEGQGFVRKQWKRYEALWKTFNTLIWPAFHGRNMVDSTWRAYARINAKAGGDTYTLRHLNEGYKEAFDGFIHSKPLTELEYGAEFKRFQKRSHFRLSAGIEGETPTATAASWGDMTGRAKTAWKSQSTRNALDPFNTIGVRDAEKYAGKSQNVLSEFGGSANEAIEHIHRYATYAALRKNKKSPAQAQYLMEKIHYDYSRRKGGALRTSFESNVMQDAVPFWGFVSNNIPYQFGQLLNRPGGGHAQTVRFLNDLQRDSPDYVPEWIRERSSARIGGPADAAHMIRSFGVSVEDPLSMLPFSHGMPNTGRVAERALSITNPIATGVMKAIAGRDLYTGRKFSDMRSPSEDWLGHRSPTGDRAIQASPIARFFTTLDMLKDTRKEGLEGGLIKAMDLVSGLKIGTYDLEKGKYEDAARNLAYDMAQDPAIKEFTAPYARKDRVPTMETYGLLEKAKRLRKSTTNLYDSRGVKKKTAEQVEQEKERKRIVRELRARK